MKKSPRRGVSSAFTPWTISCPLPFVCSALPSLSGSTLCLPIFPNVFTAPTNLCADWAVFSAHLGALFPAIFHAVCGDCTLFQWMSDFGSLLKRFIFFWPRMWRAPSPSLTSGEIRSCALCSECRGVSSLVPELLETTFCGVLLRNSIFLYVQNVMCPCWK